MRWGIVGHGSIASIFLAAVKGVGHEVVAVVGRNDARVKTFANSQSIKWSSCDTADLVGEVDAVYIATPHSSHRDIAVTLLRYGVPVLCEKPMAVNTQQVKEMISAARSSETFLMEAMWTRHLPVYSACRRWINEGALGEVQMVEASFGFNTPYDPAGRLWSPDLAGGSLLDIGIYPLTLAEWVFQAQPVAFEAQADLSPDGVDTCLVLSASYSAGQSAKLASAINRDLALDGRIIGSDGSIDIPEFWRAEQMTLNSLSGKKVDEVYEPHQINGLEYQIIEVYRCLEAGMVESPVVPWAWSLAMTELMDEIRFRIGVVYPCDKEVAL